MCQFLFLPDRFLELFLDALEVFDGAVLVLGGLGAVSLREFSRCLFHLVGGAFHRAFSGRGLARGIRFVHLVGGSFSFAGEFFLLLELLLDGLVEFLGYLPPKLGEFVLPALELLERLFLVFSGGFGALSAELVGGEVHLVGGAVETLWLLFVGLRLLVARRGLVGVGPVRIEPRLSGRGSSRDDWGLYLSCDQLLYRESALPESSQGLGVFARYGWAESEANEITGFWSMGIQYRGLLPNRDEDVLGCGMAQGIFSDRADIPTDAETIMEIYYNAQVTPWVNITPNLQYVAQPAGADDAGDALVMGIRMQMRF